MKIADLFALLDIKIKPGAEKKVDAILGGTKKKSKLLFQGIEADVKKLLKGIPGLLRKGLKIGAATGVSVFAIGAKDALAFNKQLTRLNMNSKGAVGPIDKVRRSVLNMSRETGVAKEELLAAAAGFTAVTGKGEDAIQVMDVLAKVQRGTGAEMSDLSAVAGALVNTIDVDPAQMEEAFSILIKGGKAGSVELSDLSAIMAELAPQIRDFGEGGTTGVAAVEELGAALQVVGKGAGSPAQAATQLQALLGSFSQKRTFKALGKRGIKVFDEKTINGKKVKQLRAFDDIIEQIANSEIAQDPTLIAEAFGRKEAQKALKSLIRVPGFWRKIRDETKGANDVTEDYEAFNESAAAKAEIAWNSAKVALAEAFTPERVEALSGALVKVLNVAVSIIDALSSIARGLSSFQSRAAERGKRVIEIQEQAIARGETVSTSDAARQAQNEQLSRAQSVVAGAQVAGEVGLARGKLIAAGVSPEEAERRVTTETLIDSKIAVTINPPPGTSPEAIAEGVRFQMEKVFQQRIARQAREFDAGNP